MKRALIVMTVDVSDEQVAALNDLETMENPPHADEVLQDHFGIAGNNTGLAHIHWTEEGEGPVEEVDRDLLRAYLLHRLPGRARRMLQLMAED